VSFGGTYEMNGHLYAKGTVGVGLAGFLSISGTAAATVNLDPRRDGVWGIIEAIELLTSRRLPTALPDFAFTLEGRRRSPCR